MLCKVDCGRGRRARCVAPGAIMMDPLLSGLLLSVSGAARYTGSTRMSGWSAGKQPVLSRYECSSRWLHLPTLRLETMLEKPELLGARPFVRSVQMVQEEPKSLGNLMQRHEDQGGANGLIDEGRHAPCLIGEA